MRIFSLIVVGVFSLFIFTKSADAKLLPQATQSKQKQTVSARAPVGTSIGVSPKLRADKKAVIVYFSNLQNVTAVSYLLTYQTSTQEEGAMGNLNLTGLPTATSELLFGTCSKNVCRYHTGIKNAKFQVTYTKNNGKKYIKKFKIKL